MDKTAAMHVSTRSGQGHGRADALGTRQERFEDGIQIKPHAVSYFAAVAVFYDSM